MQWHLPRLERSTVAADIADRVKLTFTGFMINFSHEVLKPATNEYLLRPFGVHHPQSLIFRLQVLGSAPALPCVPTDDSRPTQRRSIPVA